MIDKIRKSLVRKYTAIIAIILITVFCSGSYLNLQITLRNIDKTLMAYLDEEEHEASEIFAEKTVIPQSVEYTDSRTNVLLSFWFKGENLVYAELPTNPHFSTALLEAVKNDNFQTETIHQQKVKNRWYFRMMSRNLYQNGKQIGKVVVVSNTTNLHHNFNHLFAVSSIVIVFLLILAFFISNLLASKAIMQIEAMFERQKKFVSDASHELRTPLSVMLAYTELLEHKKSSPEIIRRLKDEITSMADFTGKLLQFARFDNNQALVNKEPFDLTAFLQDIYQNIKPLAEQKSIKLNADIAPRLNITADKVLIRQLVYILLDNAIKYSPENSKITLSADMVKKQIHIAVQDNGIGISDENKQHIFERFFRADKARSRNNEGLGLGLAMALLIAQKHNGTIEVESKINAGSTFTVTLPA
jgi:signal transduction histidine kinase